MSDPIRQHPTLIPAQPAVLVVGERRIAIDEWPLAQSVEERRSVEVKRAGDDLLTIEPKKRAAAGTVVKAILIFLGGAAPAVIAAGCEVPWWLATFIGLAVLSFLLLLVRMQLSGLRWLHFDRKAGQLVIQRRIGFRRLPRVERTCPLNAIQAVQLLYSGKHSITEAEG